MRVASLQSASTDAARAKWRSSSSSRRISNSAFSEFSTSTSRFAPDARDLAAELGADRAAGAGDEHGAAAQVGAHAVDLDAHRVAAEHVLDAHLAHLPHQVHAAGQQLEGRRQRAHRDAALAAGGHDLLAQRARRGRDRDDHLVRLHAVEDRAAGCRGAEHLDARDAHALLARVVVDEADRRAPQPGVAAQLERHLLAAVAGAHDQHLGRRPLEDRAARRAARRPRARRSARRSRTRARAGSRARARRGAGRACRSRTGTARRSARRVETTTAFRIDSKSFWSTKRQSFEYSPNIAKITSFIATVSAIVSAEQVS